MKEQTTKRTNPQIKKKLAEKTTEKTERINS